MRHIVNVIFAEDVRMPADELLDAQSHRVCNLKAALFGRDLPDHGDDPKHIAQLLGDMRLILGVHRLQRLAYFVEKKCPRARQSLLPVPGAAVRRPQVCHHLLQIGIAAMVQGGHVQAGALAKAG